MPIVFDKIVSPDIKVVLWEITENIDELFLQLPDSIKKQVEKFNHPIRKIEYATSRLCVLHAGVIENIEYTDSGKPYTKTHFISITHTDGIAAAIISKTNNVAIDAEILDERILRTAKRFLNEKEYEFCNNDIEKTTLIWSCKEALFKLYGKGNIQFKNDIVVEFKNKNNLIGKIKEIENINIERIDFNKKNSPIIVWCSRKPDDLME